MSALILSIFAILFLDALVSASEAAIFSVPLSRVRMLAEKHRLGKILLKLKESMGQPITTLAAISNLITIGGSILTGITAQKALGVEWMSIFAAMLTFLIMVFSEIVPKRIGERYAEPLALAVSPAVRVLSVIFAPFIWLIEIITKPFTPRERALTSEEEIAFLVRIGGNEGAIEQDEAAMITRVFKLNDITAADMMTPFPLVSLIDGEKTIGELADHIKNATHSLLPVFVGEKNHIIGIARQRDLLRAVANEELSQHVRAYARPAMIVPDSRLADDLLRDFQQQKRQQLAIVISEYGNTIGVIAMEDIFEELVGETIAKQDVAPRLIKRLSKTEILAHGQTPIAAINHFFNTDIKSKKKTLHGFLLEAFGKLPQLGDQYTTSDVLFIIDAIGQNGVERVKIVKQN